MSFEPDVLIFGTSLDPASRSQVLAREIAHRLSARCHPHRLIDLRKLDLPLCGMPSADDHPAVVELRDAAETATRVVFCSPIYNYDLNAAAKNLIELLTCNSMLDKTVAIACAAAGDRSYMSPVGFINSLMLDFRAWIVPRYVYATRSAFDGNQLVDEELHRRLDGLVSALLKGPLPTHTPA